MDGNQESELPAHQQVTAGSDAYVIASNLHAHWAPPVLADEGDEPVLGFVNSAGVQVGSGNVQVNNFYGGSTRSNADAASLVSAASAAASSSYCGQVSGAVSSSRLLVATESLRGHSLRIWDAVTGEKKATIRDFFERIAFSPDGTLLATSSNGRTARIWDVATGTARATLTGQQGIVWPVAFSPDGTLLATVGMGESTVRIWDTSTSAARATLTGSRSPARDIAFSPDSTLLAIATGGTARVWDIATGALRASLRGHTSGIIALAFSLDGTLLATGSSDETARIWEAATGAVRAILIGHRGPARRVAFSPDGTLLATIDHHCMLRIWDASVGTSRATRTGPIWGAALAPYGKLRTFGHDVALILTTVKPEGDGVAFSPDGVLLAGWGNGNAVQIWDAVTGAHRITLKNHRGLLRAVAFMAGNPCPFTGVPGIDVS